MPSDNALPNALHMHIYGFLRSLMTINFEYTVPLFFVYFQTKGGW